MIIRSFSTLLMDVIDLTFDISTVTYSLITTGFLVIYVVGLFMFINASLVEKKLRGFVKWTPFIPVIISLISIEAVAELRDLYNVCYSGTISAFMSRCRAPRSAWISDIL